MFLLLYAAQFVGLCYSSRGWGAQMGLEGGREITADPDPDVGTAADVAVAVAVDTHRVRGGRC